MLKSYFAPNLLFYVTVPFQGKTQPYLISRFPRIFWAGKRESLIFVIAPKDKANVLKRLVPPLALEKGKALVKLLEEEDEIWRGFDKYEAKKEKAKACFNKRKKLAEDFPNWAFANYLIGYPLFMTGEREEGLKYLKKAVQLEPSAFYHIALASAYATVGDRENALEEIKKVQGRGKWCKPCLCLSSSVSIVQGGEMERSGGIDKKH
ncbi:hypothetical protein H5T87_11130 [bacterium]|nr:hypothetical protein [bacterium]